MACKDCLQNCDTIIQDRCVIYTGEEIPLLDICPGDSISQLEAAVVEKLLGLLDGTGVSPADVTVANCQWLKERLGALPPNMSNLFQLLIDASCTLKELIDDINTELDNNTVFNTACLTGLPADPSRDDILQAAITLLCSVKTTVDAIPSTYVQLSDLTNLVTQIVNEINGGGSTVAQNYAKMVPYVAYEYYGSLSNFDGTGKGLEPLGFEKVYLCNGQNGTPDKRGRVAVGAIRSVPGGALDAAVDPTVSTLNPNWGVNDKAGENNHTMTVPEMPTHSHPVTDPGHKHSINGQTGGDNNDNSNTTRFAGGDKGVNESGFFFTNTQACQTATTGITVGNTGGGQPHNNIQPSIAAYYIMYIP